MKTFTLNNGMSVVLVPSQDYSSCLSINVGHVNEPKTGIAALFEKTLLRQVTGIVPDFGGTMTAYTACGEDVEDMLQKLSQIFNATVVDEAFVEQAKTDIENSTLCEAQRIMRRMKLLYKHTAYSYGRVVEPDEYLRRIRSYTVEEVREFANTYYTGRNAVLVISGRVGDLEQAKDAIKRYFGDIPAGQPHPKSAKDIYTGGFGRLDSPDAKVRLMFGFDAASLTIDDSPVANVLMVMFLRRLELAFANAGIKATVIVGISGYYGLRNIQAFIEAEDTDANQVTDVFIKVVNRLCQEVASDERLEKSKNRAMNGKLKWETEEERKKGEFNHKVLEVAWQMVGRGRMYDINDRIQSVSSVDAHDVRELACRIFCEGVPTYVVATNSDDEVYSLEELQAKLMF